MTTPLNGAVIRDTRTYPYPSPVELWIPVGPLGSRHCVFGGRHTRICFQIFSLRFVDFLLRYQFRTALLHIGKPRVGEVGDLGSGSRAAEFFFGAREILSAAANGGLVELELLLEFRNLQNGEQLALAYIRPPID